MLKRTGLIVLTLMMCGIFAHCGTLNQREASNWNVDRLVGCKNTWVPGSGHGKAPTPRRPALHAGGMNSH